MTKNSLKSEHKAGINGSPNPSHFEQHKQKRALSSFAPVLDHVVQFPGFSPFWAKKHGKFSLRSFGANSLRFFGCKTVLQSLQLLKKSQQVVGNYSHENVFA